MPNPEWTEGKLEFDFSGAIAPVKKPDTLESQLKCVDFLAIYPTETWLIECKDPEAAGLAHQVGSIKGMLTNIQNDSLLKSHLLPKIYGTYAYLAMSETLPQVMIRYGVVVGLSTLDAPTRNILSDKIQRVIDQVGPKSPHTQAVPIVDFHNVASWNAMFPDKQITRHP